MPIAIPAMHSFWGYGVITSPPLWSVIIKGHVRIFSPDAEEFSIPVPVEELTIDPHTH